MANITFHAKRSLRLGCVLCSSLDPILGATGQRNGALGVYLAIQAPLLREWRIIYRPDQVFSKFQKGVLGGKHHLNAKRSLLPGCVLTTSLYPILGATGQRKGTLRVYLAIGAPRFPEWRIIYSSNEVFSTFQKKVLGGKHHLSCKAKSTTQLCALRQPIPYFRGKWPKKRCP